MSLKPSTVPANPPVPLIITAVPIAQLRVEHSFYSTPAFQKMKYRLGQELTKNADNPETKYRINAEYQKISSLAKSLKIDDPKAADMIGVHLFMRFKNVIGIGMILAIIKDALPRTFEKIRAKLVHDQAQAAAAAAAKNAGTETVTTLVPAAQPSEKNENEDPRPSLQLSMINPNAADKQLNLIKCRNCRTVMREIWSVKCGHTFCKDCLLKVLSLKTKKACPLCSTRISKSQMRRIYL